MFPFVNGIFTKINISERKFDKRHNSPFLVRFWLLKIISKCNLTSSLKHIWLFSSICYNFQGKLQRTFPETTDKYLNKYGLILRSNYIKWKLKYLPINFMAFEMMVVPINVGLQSLIMNLAMCNFSEMLLLSHGAVQQKKKTLNGF